MLKLNHNKCLKGLARAISNSKINKGELAEIAAGAKELPEDILNFLGRRHFRQSLERLCENESQAYFVTSVDSESHDFEFKDGVKVYDYNKRVCAEYDAITYCSGILVVWEVCLASGASQSTAKIPRRIKDTLSLPRIRHQLKPLDFTETGYAVVVYSHQAELPRLRQNDFCKRGGLIVPFSEDYAAFCSGMTEELSRYGIKVSQVIDRDSGIFHIK